MTAQSAPPSASLLQDQVQALLDGPAGMPPPGLIPNFDSPSKLNPSAVAIIIFCMTLATIAVAIRIYTKICLFKSLMYEDYAILLAWVGEVGLFALSMLDLEDNGGKHMWNIQLRNLFYLLYWENIFSICYGIVVLLIKCSILLQFLRIFAPVRNVNMTLYATIHTMIWSISLFYFIVTISAIAICSPRQKTWDKLITTRHCFSTDAVVMATGIFNVISDFAVLILPMFPTWRLQTPLKKKLGIMAIFGTGICACMTSIIRTYYTWKTLHQPDVSYNLTIMALWTWGEMTAGTLVSCLPVAPRFFQHFRSRINGAFSHGTKSSSAAGRNSTSNTTFNSLQRRFGITFQPKWPFGKDSSGSTSETSSASYSRQPRYTGQLSVLSELGVSEFVSDTMNALHHITTEERVTRLGDLENGYQTS